MTIGEMQNKMEEMAERAQDTIELLYDQELPAEKEAECSRYIQELDNIMKKLMQIFY